MSVEFYWVAVVLVTIVSSARLTRLAVYDEFPPVKWLRDKYADATDPSNWQLLAICGYCMSFWVTSVVIVSGYFASAYGPGDQPPEHFAAFVAWWLVNGALAASYLSAWFVANDGDKTQGKG